MTYFDLIPKGNLRFNVVANTSQNGSIESAEHEKRGRLLKVFISSIKTKIPKDLNKFMLNDDNKTVFLILVFHSEKQDVSSILQTEEIFLSGENECFTIASNSLLVTTSQ